MTPLEETKKFLIEEMEHNKKVIIERFKKLKRKNKNLSKHNN